MEWQVKLLKVVRQCSSQFVSGSIVVSIGVLSTHPFDFLQFFPINRNHHHFSDDVGCQKLSIVCNCEVEDEDEDAAGGFLRGIL